MLFASVNARPRSASTHDLRSIGRIVFPNGETLSSPLGEFKVSPRGCSIADMLTVEETRRARLRMLVTRFTSMANLCEQLGFARNETARLTRILNANLRHDRDSKPYNMGSPMARQIEQKLKLDEGWMDTPPSYAELHGEHDPRVKAMILMEDLPDDQWETALRLLHALAKPTHKNGTDN